MLFFESRVYVVMLRLIGVVSLIVGLGLTGILIGSVFVPGFAKFR